MIIGVLCPLLCKWYAKFSFHLGAISDHLFSGLYFNPLIISWWNLSCQNTRLSDSVFCYALTRHWMDVWCVYTGTAHISCAYIEIIRHDIIVSVVMVYEIGHVNCADSYHPGAVYLFAYKLHQILTFLCKRQIVYALIDSRTISSSYTWTHNYKILDDASGR